MQHASLVAVLEGKLTPEQFGAEIRDEVTACNEAIRSGKPGYIIISDGPLTIITRDNARRLLEAIADERLPFELANYSADCIIMSDNFEFADAAVNDAVYFVADDCVAPTVTEVRHAIERLAS